LNAPTSDGQNQALNNAYLGTQGNQMQGGALNAILSGRFNVDAQQSPFAGPNSYLDGVVNDSNRDITNSYLQGAGVQLPT
jgi:hypothetical protein